MRVKNTFLPLVNQSDENINYLSGTFNLMCGRKLSMCVHALLELFLFGSSAMAKLKKKVKSLSCDLSGSAHVFHIRPYDKNGLTSIAVFLC